MRYSFQTFFPANKVAMSCSVDVLYYACKTVLLKLFRWLRATNTFLKGHLLVSPGLYIKGLEDSTGNCHIVVCGC